MDILVILSICLFITAHELGHYKAMRDCGVEVKEISLLGFGSTLLSFRLPLLFGNTLLCIKAIPLGASVTATKEGTEKMNTLNYAKTGYIDFAGVGVNFVLSGIYILIAAYVRDTLPVYMCWLVCVLFALGLFVKHTHYLYLLIGIVALHLIGYIMYTSVREVGLLESTGGVITGIKMAHEHKDSLADTFGYLALVSASIGVFNTLPLLPLDGGQALLKLIEVLLPRFKDSIFRYYKYTVLVILCLMGISIVSDLRVLWNWLF